MILYVVESSILVVRGLCAMDAPEFGVVKALISVCLCIVICAMHIVCNNAESNSDNMVKLGFSWVKWKFFLGVYFHHDLLTMTASALVSAEK